jgi:hypothetical protein
MKANYFYEQATPRAIEIVETVLGSKLPEVFHGLEEDFWLKIMTSQPHELVDELVDIMVHDFPSYCCLLHTVVPKGGMAGPFIFNHPQRLVWQQMVEMMAAGRSLFLLVLKARQLGISTLFAAWISWRVWREKDVKAIVIAHEVKLLEHIIGMQRVAYDHYPDIQGIRPRLRKGNHGNTIPRGELYYADRRSGCVLHVAKNLDPRGLSAPIIWESEKAFFPDAATLDGALLPQLPSLGTPERQRCSFFSESTPYGQNYFYEEYMSCEPCYPAQRTWEDYQSGKIESETKALFLPWMVHYQRDFGGYAIECPADLRLTKAEREEQKRLSKIRRDYDGQDVTREQMYWRRIMINDKYKGDDERFNMEFPSDDVSCFLMYSENAFREVIPYLQDCVNQADDRAIQAWAKPPRSRKVTGAVKGRMSYELPQRESVECEGRLKNVRFEEGPGPLTVWEPPEEGERYVCFLDPCNGIPGGDNAVIQVLAVRRARQVAEWADVVNPVKAVDMLCAIGTWYNTALINAEINIHGYTILNRANERMYGNQFRWPKFDEANKLSHKRFWETTTRSRGMMFSSLLYWFQEKMIAISSKHLLSELTTFKKILDNEVDGSETYIKAVFKQQKNMPDDRTTSTAGAIQTIKQSSKTNMDFVPYILPPTAQEAGLQGSRRQEAVSLERAARNDSTAAEILEKLTGENVYNTPWNPIRGFDVA